MKKSLLALAVLGAFAGVASAQSSVTLNGTVDLGARSVKNGSAGTFRTMSQNGVNSSQLVFSGTEDLGGGLFAGFVLNSGVNPDTGTSNTVTTAGAVTASRFWSRRSTVSLWGGFGEVRLGRDYNPTFWNQTLFDPFGTNGIGSMPQVNPIAGLNTNQTTVSQARTDNAVSYFLPTSLGAVSGHLMISPNENAAGASGNKYAGGRLGFNAGPIAAGISYGQTTVAKVGAEDKLKLFNVAGSYDFGVAKVDVQFSQSKFGNVKQNGFQLGAVAPVGQGEIRAAYNRIDNSGGGAGSGLADADDNNHYALGYIYNLSKRTLLYGTVASLSNKGASVQTLPGGAAGIKGGERSTGYEFGLSHKF